MNAAYNGHVFPCLSASLFGVVGYMTFPYNWHIGGMMMWNCLISLMYHSTGNINVAFVDEASSRISGLYFSLYMIWWYGNWFPLICAWVAFDNFLYLLETGAWSPLMHSILVHIPCIAGFISIYSDILSEARANAVASASLSYT
jgi:hypothetical protein